MVYQAFYFFLSLIILQQSPHHSLLTSFYSYSCLQECFLACHSLPFSSSKITSIQAIFKTSDSTAESKAKRSFRALHISTSTSPVVNLVKLLLVYVKTAFELTIPCTRTEEGIASMYMSLAIANSSMYQIPGSPLKIHIRKSCTGVKTGQKAPQN